MLKVNKFNIIYIQSAIIGFTYVATQSAKSELLNHLGNILFTLILIVQILQNLAIIVKNDKANISFIIKQIFSLHFSMAISAQLLIDPVYTLWVPDSLATHIPKTLDLIRFLQGGDFPLLQPGKQFGVITHLTNALFMSLFGVNSFSTIISQLFFKLFAIYFIYKSSMIIFKVRAISLLAPTLYALCPTVLFYTITFYKESTVHALMSATLYFILSIFINGKIKHVPLLFLSLVILFLERFYLSFLMLMPIGLFLLSSRTKNIYKVVSVFFLSIAAFYISKNYTEYSLVKVFQNLKVLRQSHMNLPGINISLNYDIWYPLALIKTIFTPFISPEKFIVFKKFSGLLIWGSLLNQTIILTAFLSFIKEIKKQKTHIIIWMPFITFLLLAAYISPWAGRIRDSFYPIISIYSAHLLYTLPKESDLVKNLLKKYFK